MDNKHKYPASRHNSKKRPDWAYKPPWCKRALTKILSVMRKNAFSPKSLARLREQYGTFETPLLEKRFIDTIQDNPAACKFYMDYIKVTKNPLSND